ASVNALGRRLEVGPTRPRPPAVSRGMHMGLFDWLRRLLGGDRPPPGKEPPPEPRERAPAPPPPAPARAPAGGGRPPAPAPPPAGARVRLAGGGAAGGGHRRGRRHRLAGCRVTRAARSRPGRPDHFDTTAPAAGSPPAGPGRPQAAGARGRPGAGRRRLPTHR